ISFLGLMESIKAVPGKWKIVVVDSKSTRILTAACKMYDILEENVGSIIQMVEPVLMCVCFA
ncbi:hypothetical protein BJV82DRAFT_518983, partial [Fennellomyces sp. T-0311]